MPRHAIASAVAHRGAPPAPQRRAQGDRPGPGGHLARALAAGARGPRRARQRDTYFAVPRGRLKLREEEPGGATLIAYDRPDAAARARVGYRLVPVADAARAARRARGARRPRRGRSSGGGCCCGRPSASTSTRSTASALPRARGRGGRRLGPRARARAGGPPARGARRSATRRCARAPTPTRSRPAGRTRSCSRSPARPRRNAYAPYSRFPVGAAVRTTDGRRYAGRQRRERRLPAGPVRGGLRARRDGGRRRRHGGRGGRGRAEPRAVHAVRRLPPAAARVRRRRTRRSISPTTERVRRTTSLAELLPLSFGPEHLAA